MSEAICSSNQPARCATDKRRGMVRESARLAGMDYVEVDSNGTALIVHLFGTMPEGLSLRNVVIEGGRRIRDIKVLSAQFVQHGDGDTCLHVTIDKPGDFSPYCICLIDPTEAFVECLSDKPTAVERKIPAGIDPRYACAPLLFRTDCPSTIDCKPQPCPQEPAPPPPSINYLARDFQSFRQLMLDRLLVTMPQWQERHIPDIGITLIELMAYVADQLSYSLDAVATEAYLSTARLRISVRRHARLVDYRMHEGCNARAWVCIESDANQTFKINDLAFGMLPDGVSGLVPGQVGWVILQKIPGALIYEPIDIDGTGQVSIIAAHSEIHFYTWEGEECCLPAGSTKACLRDELSDSKGGNIEGLPGGLSDKADTDQPKPVKKTNVADPSSEISGSTISMATANQDQHSSVALSERPLELKKGDVLILEEIRGQRTGDTADADPGKRHVVRLTQVTQSVDPLNGIRVLEVEWGRQDALPFTLCLSTRTDAPDCKFVETALARGNVVLVDHGMTVDESNDQWVVETEVLTGCCGCEGAIIDLPSVAKPFSVILEKAMLTYTELLDPNKVGDLSAVVLLNQDPRKAVARINLDDDRISSFSPGAQAATPDSGSKTVWRNAWDWVSVPDLLASQSTDRHFVVEMDDDDVAHLRFGDGDCGRLPEPGQQFRARYRVGNGTIGNVGRDAIVWIARKSGVLSGVSMHPRNPLSAVGGIDQEPVALVKLYAPHAYSRVLERAVAASDYAELAERDPRIESAYAELAWTGSWYEADVSLDPYEQAEWDDSIATDIEWQLERARRIGHDLRIVQARKVPLVIGLNVCVAPNYSSSDVELAIRGVLSNRRLADGSLGLFHPDRLEFGTDVKASAIVAAVQKLEGVSHVEITEFRRLDTAPDKPSTSDNSLANNFIAIGRSEIAQLDNDRNFPENGTLNIYMMGGI